MPKFRAVYFLVALNCVLYWCSWQMPLDEDNYWSYLGYGFCHANGLHLGLNMLALLTFGLGVERAIGMLEFVLLYVGSVIMGALVQMVATPDVPVVGASAGVFGLVVMYGSLYPASKVILLVVPMTARVLVWMYLALSVVCVVMGWMPGVAHWAHLGGAAFGLGWALVHRMNIHV